ncbi:PA2169 family four-helix-bundle protein [Aurantiacibacter gangjinensis]|uniref:Uncharacterized protein n=1 Tax=Aurantiacibacter gangjinensis TaxID=502682 RepID=A0A0G9MUX2_9SPHN|nr:PA2169 family four-helix-bundle protein [Aurantiacibacter gangjinensis]APE28978.1 hypothetical protein BMF35_a2149 [Aurantiacibacter gangjinensis]KLE33093.1 hypothetical protein AAW01_03630 [Aurantiacibacter gangjinensis]
MNNNQSTLNSLATTTFDSVRGYRKAAEIADNPQLSQQLEQRANSREQTLGTLNAELSRLGCEQVNEQSFSGQAHQMFASISDAFENGDEAAAERVEEGEDYIAGQFRDALDGSDLEGSSRQVVEQAYQEIQSGEQFGDRIENQYD